MRKIILAIAIAAAPSAAMADCKVKKTQYDKLQSGMSYSQAVAILGCEGEENARSDMAGYSTVIYSWYGSRWSGANMNATFQNGRMVGKAQVGLK